MVITVHTYVMGHMQKHWWPCIDAVCMVNWQTAYWYIHICHSLSDWSSLVPVMACHLLGAKPLTEPMATFVKWTLKYLFQCNFNRNSNICIAPIQPAFIAVKLEHKWYFGLTEAPRNSHFREDMRCLMYFEESCPHWNETALLNLTTSAVLC